VRLAEVTIAGLYQQCKSSREVAANAVKRSVESHSTGFEGHVDRLSLGSRLPA
jgi:hypothetical protein